MSTNHVFRVLLVLAAVAMAARLPAQAGLDPGFAGFGAGGTAVLSGVEFDRSTDLHVAVHPNGKIVAIGNTESAVAVFRFLANGAPDPTFRGTGLAMISDPFVRLFGHAVAIQDDESIFVAGSLVTGSRVSSSSQAMVARLTAAGELDTSFGGSGIVTETFLSGTSFASAVAVQDDGKVVIAGAANIDGDMDFAVARFLTNGTLDRSFAGKGWRTTGLGEDDRARALAIQSDGRIVAAGVRFDIPSNYYLNPFDDDSEIAMIRLHADGSLDGALDDDGELTEDIGQSATADAVFILPDDDIITVGQGGGGDFTDAGYRVARFNSSGSFDGALAGDGTLVFGGSDGDATCGAALAANGSIVIVGTHFTPQGTRQIGVRRIRANGAEDPSLDDNGRLFLGTSGADSGHDVAVSADNKILVLAKLNGAPALLRLFPDGSLDAGGRQTLAFNDAFLGPWAHEIAGGMDVQVDGKIVIAGEIANVTSTDSDFAVARLSSDGQPDLSFGDYGRVRFGFGARDGAKAVAVQADGRIVAAGYTRLGSQSNFMVARFTATGAPDSSFALFAFNVVDFAGGDDVATAVAVAPNQKIVAAGHAFKGGRNVFAVARFETNGVLDGTFGDAGKVAFDFGVNAEAHAVLVQSDNRIVVGGTRNGDFAVIRLNEDGSMDRGFGTEVEPVVKAIGVRRPGDVRAVVRSGVQVTDMGGVDAIFALALQPNGAILAAGLRGGLFAGDYALARYTTSGQLDSTFGSGGKVFLDFGGVDVALAATVRQDGFILVAGTGPGLVTVAQLRPSGELDRTLGSTGTQVTSLGGGDQYATSVKFVAPDRVVVFGHQNTGGNSNFGLAQYLTSPVAGVLPRLTGPRVPSDANQDSKLDISDAVWLLSHLFLGTNRDLPCEGGTSAQPGPGELKLLDSNGDRRIDISDAVRVLGYLFGGTQPPPVLGMQAVNIAGCGAN